MTPEITTVSQQTAAAAATAAGQYVTKVLVHEAPIMTTISNEVVIDDNVLYQDVTAPAQYYQAREFIPAVSLVGNGIPVNSPLIAVANTPPFVPETLGAAVDVVPQFGSHDGNQETPDTDAIPEQEHENIQTVPIQQTQPQNQGYYGGGPRSGGYPNQRGRMGYGGGRGRGGFPNGRGGRGGRGGYSNGGRGERQFYDQGGQGGQGGNFYPRNQNYYGDGRRGRGPRGGGGYNGGYNGHPNGPAQSAPPQAPAAVATGSA